MNNVMEIVGIRPVDYVSKKTNNRVVGTNLFVTYEENGTAGVAVDRIYMSDQVRDGRVFEVGDLISVYYNRYGSVEAIERQ